MEIFKNMLKKSGFIALLAALLAGMIGCDAGLTVGSKSLGVRSGEFVYTEGYVISSYNDSIERVWQSAEAVMKDLKAYDVRKEKKIAEGTITGLVTEEKVTIRVAYVDRDKTSVAILVGMGGSKLAAGLIHDKLTQKLAKR